LALEIVLGKPAGKNSYFATRYIVGCSRVPLPLPLNLPCNYGGIETGFVWGGAEFVRVIFSRKGFDSASGGCASPIVDGRPISLPIPTRMPTPTTFGDLGSIAELARDLSRGRITADTPCHLDPDLIATSIPRQSAWRGALGQVGAAQGHLANQGVGAGDLFLFWGLFRPVRFAGRWEYAGAAEHRIFGWLQVGEVLPTGTDPTRTLNRFPWLQSHPHAGVGWSLSNSIYVASPELNLDGKPQGMPGWGVFSRGLRLTAPDATQTSQWNVPAWLNPKTGGVGMTFHPDARWNESGTCIAASRGQEFVATIDDRVDAREWMSRLMETA
jgi:Nucleotide modification associated domain 3